MCSFWRASRVYYQRVVSGTVPTVILNGDTMISNAQVAADAAARAMTLPVYAIYSVALNLAVAAGFLAAGALILWKAQGDWFRWLAAFVLIFFPLGTLQTLIQVAGYDYTWVMLGSILWPTFLLFLYLFPNGRACRGAALAWPMGVILSVHLAIQTVACSSLHLDAAGRHCADGFVLCGVYPDRICPHPVLPDLPLPRPVNAHRASADQMVCRRLNGRGRGICGRNLAFR